MYSYEERMKAVKLYIKYEQSFNTMSLGHVNPPMFGVVT
ncbi:Hypothetical protein TES5_702 [Trichococcus sp. ES5]|nr:Hypothetical protein TES5_702 [Trichococcus sp. ES5]